jgi:hypothetical protein
METATTPIPTQSAYKPGGTMSLAVGDIIGRIQSSGRDSLGRWCHLTLRRSTGPPITIIVTYQVVATDPTTSGPTTYATQLCSLYHRENRYHPDDLRHHHANDLIAFVKACRARGEWLIVAGDFNEVIGSTPDGLTRLCSECGLYDAIVDKHQATGFAMYARGHDVLDYILVDDHVRRTIVATGYEPFGVRILSDHRGVYIDVSTSHFFGGTIQPLLPMQQRDISTRRPHQIQPYFTAKDNHLQQHNWYNRIEKLENQMEDNAPNHALAENLYNRLIQASQYAGSKLKKYPSASYSPEIAKLRNKQRLLKLAISHHKGLYDLSAPIQATQNIMGDTTYSVPTTLRECQLALVRTTAELRAVIQEEEKSRHL